jgi:hypothetical protein
LLSTIFAEEPQNSVNSIAFPWMYSFPALTATARRVVLRCPIRQSSLFSR